MLLRRYHDKESERIDQEVKQERDVEKPKKRKSKKEQGEE